MKTIYLKNETFEYNSLDGLSEVFKKHNITLKDECVLGNECTLGDGCALGYGCELKDGCMLRDGCILGDMCILGYGCILECRCTLKNECHLGNDCILEEGCTLGYKCWLGDRCRILENTQTDKIIEFNNYYEYKASGYLDTNTCKNVIQLGCYCRFVKDWDESFWNNDNEFPDNGSKKSNARLMVYESLKHILNYYTIKYRGNN